jgi:hypothetical protein
MFKKNIDDRLESWALHRATVEESSTPLDDVWHFWANAPFVPYNRNIDPHNKTTWATPWEIIAENVYDDFTKALMIAQTLKLTKRFNKSVIQIKILVDRSQSRQYNVVCVDDMWAINYSDNGPVALENVPESFYLENIIEVEVPR